MNTISANLSQPDGTAFTGPVIVSSLPNHYKYQGKEYQPDGFDTDNNNTLDTYLAWSDFDARFFDVQLGRWHVPDPANQHLSPYVGMGNNPANRIDPDGMNDGKITYHASLPEVEVFGEKMRYVYVYIGGTDANQEGSTFSWFPNNGGGTHSTYRKGGGGNGGAVNRYRYDNSVTGSYPRSNRTTPTRKTTPAEETAKKKQNELQNIVDSKKDELNAINKIKKEAEEAQGQGGSWASSVDWAGVTNASLNVLGGVGEMIVGGAGEYFSAGTATPVCVPLIIDGGYRTATNFSRLVGYLTLNDRFANAMPGNIGATIGKGIDMLSGVPINGYGYGQGIGGATNDFVSFIVTGGTAVSMSNMVSNPSLMNGVWYMSAYGGYTNSLFYDLYPLKK